MSSCAPPPQPISTLTTLAPDTSAATSYGRQVRPEGKAIIVELREVLTLLDRVRTMRDSFLRERDELRSKVMNLRWQVQERDHQLRVANMRANSRQKDVDRLDAMYRALRTERNTLRR